MDQDIFVDRPIEGAKDDLFGRKPFAAAIASAIATWKGSESLTIAVSGKWGSGKSSLKNLILEALPEGDNKPSIVDFNPWKYATPAEASKAFFREVSIALKRADPTQTGADRAKRWDRYSKILTLTSELAQGTVDAFPTLISLAAYAGVSAAIIQNPIFSITLAIVAGALIALASALKFSASFSAKVGQWLIATSTDEPLEEIKAKLKQDMQSLKRPVLVIVDDIDRLTEIETKQLFQHIKANGDFPNLLYLMLYQRDIVENHLKTEAVSGRDYVEKIVDLHFDLPPAGQEDINKILFEGLDRLLNKVKGAPEFDQTRWGSVYLGGMQVFFTTPRNVKRFLSTLGVQFRLLQGSMAFEVNQIDLIALESLRLFEPQVFSAIRSSSTTLTASSEDSDSREERKAEVQRIVALADARHQSNVRDLLIEMFPRIAWVFGGANYGSDWASEWTVARRICSPTFFERYFRLAVPQREISQSDLQVLIDAARDRAQFTSEFQAMETRGQGDSALARLEDYKQKIPLSVATEFLPALFDIGDRLSDDPGTFVGSFTHLARITLWYLRQERQVEERGRLLLDAMQVSDGLALGSRLLRGEEQRQQKKSADIEFAMFTADQLAQAKSLWIAKFVEKGRRDNVALARMPRFLGMLYGWREWAGDSPAREWVTDLIKTDEGLLAFLSGASGVVTTTSGNSSSQRLVTRLQTIADFASVEEIESRVSRIARDTLQEGDRLALESFDRALRRRAAGKSDDGFADDDE